MARLPKRRQPGDYALDVPGGKAWLWKGVHASNDLPRLLNPKHGYIQNANNPPWFASRSDPIDPARFPAYLERGPLGLRPQLILDALDTPRLFSPEEVRDLKYTSRFLSAERLLPDLLVLTPDIFDILENVGFGRGGEIQLTDALNGLLKKRSMYGYIFKGKRYDAGDKVGYLKATVDLALKNPEVSEQFKEYLIEVATTMQGSKQK